MHGIQIVVATKARHQCVALPRHNSRTLAALLKNNCPPLLNSPLIRLPTPNTTAVLLEGQSRTDRTHTRCPSPCYTRIRAWCQYSNNVFLVLPWSVNVSPSLLGRTEEAKVPSESGQHLQPTTPQVLMRARQRSGSRALELHTTDECLPRMTRTHVTLVDSPHKPWTHLRQKAQTYLLAISRDSPIKPQQLGHFSQIYRHHPGEQTSRVPTQTSHDGSAEARRPLCQVKTYRQLLRAEPQTEVKPSAVVQASTWPWKGSP